MAIDGLPDYWSTDFKQLIPIILDLILESWKTFPVPTKPRVYEPRINRQFCRHLRNHKDRSKHFFALWVQAELLSKGGALIGQPDLIFSPFTTDEDKYFACECKLLNRTDTKGKWSSLAGEYIEEGVVRYVSGRYSGGENGGMLGYVMDADTVKAIASVNAAIQKRKAKLSISHEPELRKSSIRPHCPQTRQTDHSTKSGPFRVHHVFLPVASSN